MNDYEIKCKTSESAFIPDPTFPLANKPARQVYPALYKQKGPIFLIFEMLTILL